VVCLVKVKPAVGPACFYLETRLRTFIEKNRYPSITVAIQGEERNLLDQVADDRPAHNPEKELLRSEPGACIASALRRLTPQERMVFDLKHFHGMKLRAVSEILNTSEGSVKTNLVRATRKLRLHLTRYTELQKSSLVP
jgi:RNA polymerase sigma-70 factor (ECF subfamily)